MRTDDPPKRGVHSGDTGAWIEQGSEAMKRIAGKDPTLFRVVQGIEHRLDTDGPARGVSAERQLDSAAPLAEPRLELGIRR